MVICWFEIVLQNKLSFSYKDIDLKGYSSNLQLTVNQLVMRLCKKRCLVGSQLSLS